MFSLPTLSIFVQLVGVSLKPQPCNQLVGMAWTKFAVRRGLDLTSAEGLMSVTHILLEILFIKQHKNVVQTGCPSCAPSTSTNHINVQPCQELLIMSSHI